MDGEDQRRTAANEAMFRDVTEAIERGQWPGEDDEPVGFRCECARLGCNQVIALTVPEYERVRAHSRRFVVAPGHELPEAETIIEVAAGCFVVEKRDQAGTVAEATDPRD
jgi:hypothetical protein